MSIDIEVKDIHTEIARHIKKETGKGVRPESVALVLDGARDYRAGEKERAAKRRIERREAKIAELQAKLAALTGADIEPEAKAKPVKKAAVKPKAEPEVEEPAEPVNVTPITKKRAAKKAAPAPKAEVEDDFEDGIENTPEGALPIEVTVSEDSFETSDEDEDDEWDIGEDEDDEEDAEDF